MAFHLDWWMPLSLFQESVDAEGPVVEKIMSSRLVKKQVSAVCKGGGDPSGVAFPVWRWVWWGRGGSGGSGVRGQPAKASLFYM